MKYISVVDYYKKNALKFMDEAERIADESYTVKMKALNTSPQIIPELLNQHLLHFLRSIRRELFAIRLHFIMMETALRRPEWWSLTHPSYSTNVIFHMLESYDMNIKRGYIIGVFSTMEHCFRHFVRKIESEKDGMKDFWKVRDMIFNIDKRIVRYRSMLGLYANIRNEIHNDGIFYSANNQNVEIEYQGHIYTFVHGKATDFVTWELLFSITEDVAEVIYTLGTCEKIKKAYQ